MQRLTGIGVSPGVVAGRAVILIQREQVLRYHVPATRLDHELERLQASRERARQQLIGIRSGVAERRGPDIASIFDAQLLMLDDPMLVPRAADLVRQQRVNAEWAIQRVFQEFSAVFDEIADPYLRERKGDVADLVGRLKMNLRPGMATPRDAAARARRGLGADCGRADPVPRRADRLDARARLRHRRRQPHVPLGHPRALARGPGGRGTLRREPRDSARSARGDRRFGERSDRRPGRGGAGTRIRPAGRPHAGRGPGTRAARSRRHRGRRSNPARRQHRVSGRPGRGPVCGRRRHRAVPIGVPADERDAGDRRRRRRSRPQ